MKLTKRSDAMKFKVSDMLLFALSLISCAGCSVKENRGLCPCQLVLDFSQVDTVTVKSVDLFLRKEGNLILNDVVDKEEFSEDYFAYVPRTGLYLCVWSGTGDALSDALSIPYGNECPPVYIHRSEMDADGESLREVVRMRKNFCRMTLNVKMSIHTTVSLAVSGNVDGYDIYGAPSEGDFMVRLHPEEDDTFCIRLPRQLDDSLVMEVDTGDKVVRRFPIGRYIAESGYDWTAPDLEDIVIDMDFAVTHLSMMIQGWEKEYRFDVVI